MKIDVLLCTLGLSGVSMLYFRVILEISLKLGYVPHGVYQMVADRIHSTHTAVQKAVSDHTQDMWIRGKKLNLWIEDDLSVSPKKLLTEMFVLVSRDDRR